MQTVENDIRDAIKKDLPDLNYDLNVNDYKNVVRDYSIVLKDELLNKIGYSLNEDGNYEGDITTFVQVLREELGNRDIPEQLLKLLNTTKEGKLSIILPPNEAKEFQAVAINFGFYCNRKLEIYPKENKAVERVLLEYSKIQQVCIKDTLTIQKSDENNDYTEPYKELTKDFYKLF
jgi:hypothetical protein